MRRNKGVDWRPLVILGAPRSGTNMLRDLLVTHSDAATWPCDEINFIWRHYNVRHPSDEFSGGLATPRVRAYVRRAFAKLARQAGRPIVVEKTCANCLRVDFVRKILPEARFVVLLRDGRDAAASAAQRWQARFEPRYVMKKARYVPWSDLAYQAARYCGRRLHRRFSGTQRVSAWGPVFSGMVERLASDSLAEVCAWQWRRCVEQTEIGLAGASPETVFHLSYEDFVARPAEKLAQVLQFGGMATRERDVVSRVAAVSSRSVGKWRADLDSDDAERVEAIVADCKAAGRIAQRVVEQERLARNLAQPAQEPSQKNRYAA
ncbi:MAG: sulfotransferase [Planctomycetales bacterium]|nr:sulfotransferase [Planctomycetales bacterium]